MAGPASPSRQNFHVWKTNSPPLPPPPTHPLPRLSEYVRRHPLCQERVHGENVEVDHDDGRPLVNMESRSKPNQKCLYKMFEMALPTPKTYVHNDYQLYFVPNTHARAHTNTCFYRKHSSEEFSSSFSASSGTSSLLVTASVVLIGRPVRVRTGRVAYTPQQRLPSYSRSEYL